MRIDKDKIEAEGTRLSTYSKFYIWNDMLFEPVIRVGVKTNSYKAINKKWRIRNIMRAYMRAYRDEQNIPKVSDVIGKKFKPNLDSKFNKKDIIEDRSEILDL